MSNRPPGAASAAYAMWVPSGENAGSISSPGNAVIAVADVSRLSVDKNRIARKMRTATTMRKMGTRMETRKIRKTVRALA